MKKNILIMVCMLSIVSIAHARFFIGIDGGYSMDRVSARVITKSTPHGVRTTYHPFDIKNMYSGSGSFVSANLGAEYYFDEGHYAAFRWLLTGKYGQTKLVDRYKFIGTTYPSTFWSTGLGIDFLFDVIKLSKLGSIGLFVGIDTEYMGLLSNDRTPCTEESIRRGERCSLGGDNKPVRYIDFPNLLLNARVGTSIFLANHHRLEFRVQIPIVTMLSGSESTFILALDDRVSYIYKPIQFMLSYKFVF